MIDEAAVTGGRDERASDRRGSWIALLGALAIAAPRLVTAACSDPFYDERTVFDLARLAFSPCTTAAAIPWDQPPLVNLLLYPLYPLARAAGLADGVALDLPLVVGRLLVVAAPVATWLALRRALPAGPARVALFVICALSPASTELSSLAMNNGIVALPIVAALAFFGGPGRRGVALGGVALAAAVGTSYVAWPAAAGLGVGVLWLLWRRPRGDDPRPWIDSLLALGPSALLGAAWLVLSLGQSRYFEGRVGLYQIRSWTDPLLTFWESQRWYVFGREFHEQAPFSGGALAVASVGVVAWLALAVVGGLARRGGEPRWERMRPLVLGLAWGTWVAVLALLPVVWLGKGKFYLLLLAPVSLLACRGLAALLGSVRRPVRWLGVLASAALVVSLVAGVLRGPVCWDRSYQERRFYFPQPARWTCSDPWVPAVQLVQEGESTLLPATGTLICEPGGACPQPSPATVE